MGENQDQDYIAAQKKYPVKSNLISGSYFEGDMYYWSGWIGPFQLWTGKLANIVLEVCQDVNDHAKSTGLTVFYQAIFLSDNIHPVVTARPFDTAICSFSTHQILYQGLDRYTH